MTVPLQGRPQWRPNYVIPSTDGTSVPSVGAGGWDQWFGSKVDANGGSISSAVIQPAATPTPVVTSQIVADAHLLRAYGFVGDGNSHPLSAKFGTLAAAQAVYPAAQALTDEIDGTAIQAIITALGSADIILSFPVGSIGLVTRTIVSGGGAIHILGNWSALRLMTAGQDGWQHGLGQNVFNAYFRAEKLQIECEGVGGKALNVSFSAASGDFRLADVTITGIMADRNANYWTQAVVAVNASLTDFRSCFITGRPSALITATGTAISFSNSGSGSYQFAFDTVTLNGWKQAFSFASTGQPGLEGVTMYNVQANTCLVGITVTNNEPITTYQPPQFVFLACQWNIFQQIFNFQGCSEISITDNLIYLAAPSALSGSFTPEDFIYMTGVTDATIEGTMIEGSPSSTVVNMINIDTGCSVIGISGHNVIRTFGTMTGAGVRIAAGCAAVREDGSNFFFLPGGVPAFNNLAAAGSGIVLPSQAIALGGQMDIAGNITLQGDFAGTTDATGLLTVALPAGLFTSVRSVLVGNGDESALPGPVGLVRSTLSTTSFQAKFVGVSSASAARVTYTVYGY